MLMTEWVKIIDFDEGSGNLHKLEIPRNDSEGEGFTQSEIYTIKETGGISKERSNMIFDQEKILEEFLKTIKANFEVDEDRSRTKIVKGKKAPYWWYKYLRVTFQCTHVYDIVPYRWTIVKDGEDVQDKNGRLWVQGEPVFEHGEKDDIKDGMKYWQWQIKKPCPKAKLSGDRKMILVPKGGNDFFPRLDGSDLQCAIDLKDNIVEALLHWKPCGCLPRKQ